MVSTEPRLSARRASFTEFKNFFPAGIPPFNSKDIIPLKPLICSFATWCIGWEGSPGYVKDDTLEWFSKNSATFIAFSSCFFIRTSRVLTPSKVNQQSIGLGIAPIVFWANLSLLAKSSLLVIIIPPINWLCPVIYFVVLCITKSTPNSRGLKNTGVMKVESTANNKLFFFAILEIAFKSVIFNKGLVGVSAQIIFVSGLIAFSTFSGKDVSINEKCIS